MRRYLARQKWVRAAQPQQTMIDIPTPAPTAIQLPFFEAANASTIELFAGHLVTLDDNVPFAVTTPFNAFDVDLIGVIIEGGMPGETVKVQYRDVVDVLFSTSPVRIGQFVYSAFNSPVATTATGAFIGAIGRVLEGKAAGQQERLKVLLAGGLGVF